MIYNNYNTPKVSGGTDPTAVNIRKFLPKLYQRSVIIITRSSEVRISHSIQIQKLRNVDDGLEILSTVLGQERLVISEDVLNLMLPL
jgi:hypothetical protein